MEEKTGKARDEKTVRLMVCDDAVQAHIIQGALENEGIPSILHNENTASVLRGFTTTLTGVDIFVFESDLQRARDMVDANREESEKNSCCPYCKAHDIELVFRSKSWYKAVLATCLSIFCITPPGNNYYEYRCRQCGRRFDIPEEEKSSQETREE